MDKPDDMTLVREFAAHQSDTAFETLVARHINLVHSAALRQVSDPHLAQEITQAVFLILARKAARLPDGTFLLGWLFKTTRYAASAELRAADRRRRREDEAHMQSLISQTPDEAAWQHIAPLLDEALANLNETDRRAVLLRFFEGQTLGEVGAALSLNEEAARKRVNRGVEKLRKFFAKRGVTQTTAAIGVALTANSVQAAPVGLAAIISATTLKGVAVAATVTTLVNGTIKTIAMTTLQKTLITAALVVAVGMTIYEAHDAATMRTEVKTLQSQQSEQIQQLQKEREDATNKLAGMLAENSQFKSNLNQAELLKLRGNVGLLRSQLANAKSPYQQPSLSTAQDYYKRADKHAKNHEYEMQLDDLTKAIELDPNMAEAYMERGSLYAWNLPKERGGYAKAVADYTRCLELKPNDYLARWNRALFSKDLSQYESAIADYTILIEGDTDFGRVGGKNKLAARALYYRACLYQEHQKDYSKAITDYTAALQLDPETQGAHRKRGECYERMGESEKAQQDFAADPEKSN